MSDYHIEILQEQASKCCAIKNWDRDWSNGGCYLHLEVSEFIESLRGKGKDSPASEAADVLFVLFAMLSSANISIVQVLNYMSDNMKDIFDEHEAIIKAHREKLKEDPENNAGFSPKTS